MSAVAVCPAHSRGWICLPGVWNTAAAQLGCADLCTGHPVHAAALSAPSGLPGMPAWCQMLLLLWTAWYLEIPNKWTSSLFLLESV